MLYCCAWPRWWCFLTLHIPLLFPSRFPMRHRAEVATLKKQCFCRVLPILVFAFKNLNNKTPTDYCCSLLCFQGQLRRTESKCMQSWDLRTKLVSAVPLVETTPTWQSPTNCNGLWGRGKRQRPWDTSTVSTVFFLKWRVVCIKGRGKISTLVPVHLPRGWAGLTCPDPHPWIEPSACVRWQDEQCQAWSKAFQSQWEHFHWFQGLCITFLNIYKWKILYSRQPIFLRATLSCCPSVLLISEHHQKNNKANRKVLVCTTLLLLSSAEI